MTLLAGLSAMKTDYARELEARGEAEGVELGDWSFQVGDAGFNPADPEDVTDADPSLQALESPVGGSRPLGLLVSSGGAAALALGSGGVVTVTGLTGMPESSARRWLRFTGSGDPNVNGSWVIRRWLSATSVEIINPLLAAPAAGVSWEFRENCVLNPNVRAASFYCRLAPADATVDGTELGEVGIFGRVLRAPTDPALVGAEFLYCVAHMNPVVKVPEMALSRFVTVQF